MKEKNYPHLENIVDLLWLSQFTGMQSVAIEERADKREKPKDNKPKIEDNEVEEHEPNSNREELQNDLEVHTDKQEDNSPSHTKQKSAKAIKSPKKLALDHYREWERAFKFINLKTPSKNRYELDEEKTVENIASLKVFDLVFRKVEEKSFFLTIVIDQNETMELWRELIKNFEKMLMTMGVFARISLYYWDTKNKKPRLYGDKALKREVSEKVVVSDGQRNLVWVMSDCIAPAWKSGETFKSIERWTTKSFTSILQMFPKRMWMGTILFKGKHIRLSSNSFNPLNKKLQTKPSKRKRDALKIPIISFDPYSLQAWAKVVVNAKGNSISGIELKDLNFPPINTPTKREITLEMRMKRFYSQASPIAQKLAFYMSVLPVDFQVTRILQEERLPQSNQAHVAEVFLGGLIERTKKDSGVYYDFYPKIREELNANISADKSFEIMEDMSDFVSSHLGIGFDFKALLADPNGAFEGEFALSEESLAYARLASGVLKRKGGKFYEMARGIDERINKVKKEKENKFLDIEKSNLIILYKEDTLDINLLAIADHLNKICNYLIFKVGEKPFELEDKIISVPLSYIQLEKEYAHSTKNALRAIFFTEKPYYNNYFFEPRTNEKDDNLRIVSFNNWDLLTTLSKNNGAVYFIAMLVALISRKPVQHDKKTGCVYDFLGIKNDIDNNMREANICTTCLNILLEKDSFSDGRILDDLNGILNFIGKVSRNNLDIFAKEDELKESIISKLKKSAWNKSNIIQEYKIPNSRYRADLVLKYKNRILAVIEIKALKNELTAGLKQAINYGKQLDIDYVYSTNGLEIYEYSLKNEIGKYIDEYPSPDELWKQIFNKQSKEDMLRNIPYLKDNLRRHHKEAIITIIEGIINQNKRILLSLALVAGKHIILQEVLHKLYTSYWYEEKKPKILFLSDKKYVLRYMERILRELKINYINLTGYQQPKNKDFDVLLSDYKTIERAYFSYEKNFFDFVIIDEVPRESNDRMGRAERWQRILGYYGQASFISFTMLYDKKMRDYFGEVRYTYSYKDSVRDGISLPYELIKFNMNSINEKQTQKILDEIDNNIKGNEKILIVCKNQLHVEMMREVFRKRQLYENYYVIISSEDKRFNLENLQKFRKNREVHIGIITQYLLDIGVGNLTNIVLATPIKSKYLLNYLINDCSSKINRNEKNEQKKYLKLIDFFYDANQDYYDIEFDESLQEIGREKDLEIFRKKQAEKAEAERLKIEEIALKKQREKEEQQASKEWATISNTLKLDVLKSFIDKYPQTSYAQKAKERFIERETYLNSLSLVERKLEELFIKDKQKSKSILLLSSIRKGLFDTEKCEALEFLKQIMRNNKEWKEVSKAKNTQKDKWYQRTLEIMELLKECDSEDNGNSNYSSHISKKDIQKLKQQLKEEEKKLEKTLSPQMINLRRKKLKNEHDDISQSLEINNAILKQNIDQLNEIEWALERIKTNAYGICEMCEEEINIERLKVKPYARYCITCRELIEKEDFNKNK